MSRVVNRQDLRLVPVALGMWGATRMLLASTPERAVLVLVCAAVLMCWLWWASANSLWRRIAGAVCAGAFLATCVTWPVVVDRSAAQPVLGSAVTVSVTPTTYVRQTSRPSVVWAHATARFDDHEVPAVLFVDPTWAHVVPTQEVDTVCTVRRVHELAKAQVTLTNCAAPGQAQSRPVLFAAAAAAHRHFDDALSLVPGGASSLLPGLIIGTTHTQPQHLKEAMETAGLTHLTAVSGSNTALVVALAWGIATLLGCPHPVRVGCAAVGLACYAVVVGPEPSLLRASVMGALALAGALTHRSGRHLGALSVAVIGLLWVDPWLVLSIGFQLSVVATGTILIAAAPLTSYLVRTGMPTTIAAVLAVSSVATIACTPLVALTSGEISLVAIMCNVVVAPIIPVITVLGVLALVMAPLWSGGAAALLLPASWCASAVEWVAFTGSATPGASVPWKFSAHHTWLITLVIVIAVVGLWVTHALLRPARQRLLIRGLVLAVVTTTGWFLAAGQHVLLPQRAGHLPTNWALLVCDVGQGTAILLRTGPTSAVLYDAGPANGQVIGCLRDADIRQLDAIVLSHFHADHVGGLRSVVDLVPVHQVWVSAAQAPPLTAATIHAVLRERGIHTVTPPLGHQQQFGDTTLLVVNQTRPVYCGSECSGTEINDQSLVVVAQVQSLTAVLAGDIEQHTQRELVRHKQLPANIDVLAVPHHGSARQERSFMEHLTARVHIVSVGADNDYGHPHPTTLALLERTGGLVRRTDQHGWVAVTPDKVHTRR